MTRTDIISTYRLQFHKAFTFRDAAAIVPYLHDLGITHVYASPYLKAVAGSTHGYDVIDHSQFNPEIGTADDYRHFVATLTSHGMSHILDTVPNHMGVETNDNPWWNDLLAHGKKSKYANYFDIDWDGFAPRRELAGKVLMSVLGETFADALANGLLQLKSENGQSFVQYHDRKFPLDSASDTNQDLLEILSQQHYRLSHWRVAADEINYRRFFDITGLAALQMQRQDVFDDAHAFTFKLIANGNIAGLRVDHPDGLLDPQEYFDRLQNSSPIPGKLFISVEKILNGDESLCDDWPVSGTSGYDFLYAVNDLFVDSANELAITEIYESFTADRTRYADWVHRNKCLILDTAMFSEMASLTNRLDALAQLEITSRDFTRRQLHETLREIIACFPVYRSYVSSRRVGEFDKAVVNQAVEAAADRNPKVDRATLNFIRDSVLLRYPAAEATRGRQLDFAQKFQQLSSPVNAKGIEDTTFYIYNRLISLNEVGGDPGRFGRDPAAIHRYFSHRNTHWPLSLSSLSTHDTKRSEDVRARLNVLSEIPEEWAVHVNRWRDLNAAQWGKVHPADQYLLYQTLLGAWPVEEMDDATRKQFSSRMCAYMQKATREAKLRNSWVNPDQDYESAMTNLIDHLLGSQDFLADFLPFQKKISRLGMLSSLSQTTIRLTAPGIADTYQGTELWDLSLVDPDNRRPVDYQLRREMLAGLKSASDSKMDDGSIKLWLTRQLLHCRREHPGLFLEGNYEPIHAIGPYAEKVFSYMRKFDGQCLIAIVPRLMANHSSWDDTKIRLPDHSMQNIFTGHPTAGGEVSLSDILKDFPVAVLLSQN